MSIHEAKIAHPLLAERLSQAYQPRPNRPNRTRRHNVRAVAACVPDEVLESLLSGGLGGTWSDKSLSGLNVLQSRISRDYPATRRKGTSRRVHARRRLEVYALQLLSAMRTASRVQGIAAQVTERSDPAHTHSTARQGSRRRREAGGSGAVGAS